MPIGTRISVVLQEPVDCDSLENIQHITALTKADVVVAGRVIIPAHTVFLGTISRSSETEKSKCFSMQFDALRHLLRLRS